MGLECVRSAGILECTSTCAVKCVRSASMTKRQILLLFLIAKGITRRRYLYQAIGHNSALGLENQLKKLKDQGLIEHEFRKTGMSLTDTGRRALSKYAFDGTNIYSVEIVKHHEEVSA